MNEDLKPEYEDSLQAYISARVNTDSVLRTAQTPDADNAHFVINEFEKYQNLEESARDRWESVRDSYLQ